MVNVLYCELSPWRGDGELCRWCNKDPVRGGRRFCSRECTAAYANNHQYFRGRELVFAWSRSCGCKALSPQGAVLLGRPPRIAYLTLKPPHVVCNACGQCEEEIRLRGDKITVNHIVPRNGIPCSKVDCIHHIENLEPLCWRDHELLNKIGNQRDQLEDAIMREFGHA